MLANWLNPLKKSGVGLSFCIFGNAMENLITFLS